MSKSVGETKDPKVSDRTRDKPDPRPSDKPDKPDKPSGGDKKGDGKMGENRNTK